MTRLIPPVIPKRRNNRLKCAFTVRRAIFSSLAISALSQPCNSNSTICCSRGPSRTVCSFIRPPSSLISLFAVADCARGARLFVSKSHSIHNATLRRIRRLTSELAISTALYGHVHRLPRFGILLLPLVSGRRSTVRFHPGQRENARPNKGISNRRATLTEIAIPYRFEPHSPLPSSSGISRARVSPSA